MFLNFDLFADIENFQPLFPEASIEIINAYFRIILRTLWQEKCYFFENITGKLGKIFYKC
jgi:hypothetical protein